MIEHNDMLIALTAAQKDEHDMREAVREAHLFVNKRDGMWEPDWFSKNSGKPRYTFDLTNPIIDQIAGEMEQADFNINVSPAGGDATKDIADTYDGLIRNIENISNANDIFNTAGRSMVTGGLDGWQVVQRFVDDDSFDQDLMIEKISNFNERVWFDSSSELQDRSDARHCWVLQGLSLADYKEKWPKGSALSVSQDRTFTAYFNQPDRIFVGMYYHIVEVPRVLVLMENGAVYEDDDKFKSVAAELKALGIGEVKRRSRMKNVVHVRKFDAGGWLEEDKETVFSWIPVVPTYGNFKILENKSIYWGAVEKLMDPQRVMNYSLSREIEEGALAPRAKYWGTPKQREGHGDTISTLNTNNDPWQDYNTDPGVPPPMQQGGAQINPGLRIISDAMNQMITQSAGLFAANMGDNPNAQSGVAIEKLQNKGDTGTIKYFGAQEVAICHTARILIDAIPDVYSSKRQVRLLKEDGTANMVVLHDMVPDEQNPENMVELNDLSVGTYDVTCSAGPSFQNKQAETVAGIIEYAQVDPTIIQSGSDILLNNITSPGMGLLAERKREQLFNAGAIPQSQWTEEEKEQVQQQQAQAQQPQPPTPEELIGQAEILKAQTAAKEAEFGQQEAVAKFQQLEKKIAQEDRKLDHSEFKIMIEQQALQAKDQADKLTQAINGIKTLTEAFGIEALAGAAPANLIAQQGNIIDQEQDRN